MKKQFAPLTQQELSDYANFLIDCNDLAASRGCSYKTANTYLNQVHSEATKAAALRKNGRSIKKLAMVREAAKLVLQGEKVIVVSMLSGLSESAVKNLRTELAELAGSTVKQFFKRR